MVVCRNVMAQPLPLDSATTGGHMIYVVTVVFAVVALAYVKIRRQRKTS